MRRDRTITLVTVRVRSSNTLYWFNKEEEEVIIFDDARFS